LRTTLNDRDATQQPRCNRGNATAMRPRCVREPASMQTRS
jgi:hypothetical protein